MCSNVGRKNWNSVHHLYIITVLTICTLRLHALPLSQFYPSGTVSTPREDDGGSDKILLEKKFKFFGDKKASLFVNNNGILTFYDRLSDYKPKAFPLEENTALIAPFWADVDTQRVGGNVWYRQTQDDVLLSRASQEIRQYFIQQRKFQATWIFIATWDNVGFYGASGVGKQRRNTFQAVLVTDESQSFVIFNYNKIQWTTGSNSGGDLQTGLGGSPAQAGFNAGDRRNYYSIEGAQTERVQNLTLTSNVGIPGKWVFQVDGAIVHDIKCSNEKRILVYPSRASMLGGEKISIFGPCFSADFNILARIRETNDTFKCIFVSYNEVQCVVPPLFHTGKVTLELNPYELGWNYTSVFHLTNVASNVPNIRRLQPDRWIINSRVVASWNTSLTPSNPLRFEVLAFKSLEDPHFITISSTEFNISSHGLVPYTFNLTGDLQSSSSLILRISWNFTNDNFSFAPSIWSDVFPVRWESSQRSELWCKNWTEREKSTYNVTVSMGSCPCTLRQALRDTSRYTPDPFCRNTDATQALDCLYYKSATRCVQRILSLQSTSGETCCYDSQGELIDVRESPNSGGIHSRFHFRAQGDGIVPFFSFFEEDLVPYLHCCQYSTSRDMCQSFLQYHPPTTCQAYEPPTPAQGAGDPHLTTLDGKDYTFNGLGDFVLLEDVNSTVVVQVRAIQAKDTQGKSQNASVFSGVAMEIKNASDRVELYSGDSGAEVRINRNVVTMETDTSEFNGVSIHQNQTDSLTTNYLVVFESEGVSVSLDVSSDFVNVLVLIGDDKLRGRVQGLLGNYNGIAGDDFIPRNGESLSANSSLKEIHYQFGMTWTVSTEESLFSVPYPAAEEGVTYKPQFLDDVSDSGRNATVVVQLCGENLQCRFDFEVTGNERVAKSTAKFIENFKELEADIQKVVRCPFLSEPENGNKSVSGYQVGANATFWCNAGFVIVRGTTPRYCQEDGSWTGEAVDCAEPIVTPEKETNTLITAIGIGTGSGGVLFLFVLIGLLICRCRKLRKLEETEQKVASSSVGIEIIDLPTSSNIPSPVFENEAFITSLSRITKDTGFKIPRPNFVDPEVLNDYFF